MIASPLASHRPAWWFVRPGLFAALVVGSGFLAVPSRALDFQLHPVKTLDDGFTHEHSCFSYDNRTDMLIDLPKGWNITADPSSITSLSPNASGAVIRIEKSALTPNTPFRDTSLDLYRRRVLSGIPQGAVNTHIVAEKTDPLPIFGWKDYEFTVAYDFFGRSLRSSVVFINLNAKEQISMTVIASQNDFDKVHGQGMTVMQSWTPTPAS